MPSTDSTAPVAARLIPPETVALAVALTKKFRTSRSDAATTGRQLGRLLRDAERGKPGRKSSSAEKRQRLTDYQTLLEKCDLKRGTAVNLQLLAAIPEDKWGKAMRQADVPPLTALYALGRKHKESEGGGRDEDDGAEGDEGDGEGEGDAELDDAVDCVPALVDVLGHHEHRSTLLYISTHYVAATCDPPLCPPVAPSRVLTILRRLRPVLSVAGVVELFTKRAKAAIRAEDDAEDPS